MSALETAAIVEQPLFGKNTTDATGMTGMLFRTSLDAVPALQTVTLPKEVKGCHVTLLARGLDVQFVVVKDGTTKPTLTYDALAVAGTGSTNGAAGKTALNGIEKRVFIPPDAKEIVWIWKTQTAGAFFEGHVSSQRAG